MIECKKKKMETILLSWCVSVAGEQNGDHDNLQIQHGSGQIIYQQQQLVNSIPLLIFYNQMITGLYVCHQGCPWESTRVCGGTGCG